MAMKDTVSHTKLIHYVCIAGNQFDTNIKFANVRQCYVRAWNSRLPASLS